MEYLLSALRARAVRPKHKAREVRRQPHTCMPMLHTLYNWPARIAGVHAVLAPPRAPFRLRFLREASVELRTLFSTAVDSSLIAPSASPGVVPPPP